MEDLAQPFVNLGNDVRSFSISLGSRRSRKMVFKRGEISRYPESTTLYAD